MAKKIILIFGLIVITILLGILFLLLGMNIGGNFFSDFEFLGRRGYEATGTLGFIIGISIGIILSILTLYLLHKRNKA